MNTKQILVLGGTGNVSSEVVKNLVQQGYSVKTTSRDPSKQASHPKVEWVKYEASEPSVGLNQLFSNVGRAFFLSPPGYVDQFRILKPLIEKAKEHSLEKVVLMTANGVDFSDEIPFRKAEIELERSGLNFNIVRPNWFMQNFNTFWVEGIKKANAIHLPASDSKTAFIDARDISDTVTTLLTNDKWNNTAFNLSGPQSLTHTQAAQILSQQLGKSVHYENVDPDNFKKSLVKVGVPGDYASLLVMLYEGVRAGAASAVTPHVEQITGHKARELSAYVKDYKTELLG